MSDYVVDNIALDIVATAESGITALNNLLSVSEKVHAKMGELSAEIGVTNSAFKAMIDVSNRMKRENSSIVNSFKDITTESKKARTEIGGLSKELDGLSDKKMPSLSMGSDSAGGSNALDKMFSLSKVLLFTKAVIKAGKVTIGSAVEMTENYNLFSVALDKNIDRATVFQNAMSNALGTNISDTMKYQGFFTSLSENMNIASDSAYVMGENLTKLVYDLSSLYNIDVESAYGKLQSGMIGQTKPMRELGIDITAQTLQGYIDNFGWDTQIQKMTQAEKVMLRYIAILDQSRLAHGDMARSLDAPANQIRIFNNLLKETGAWIGTVFLGGLGKVLYFVNGFLMAVKEISKAVATLLGFKLSDFNFGGGKGGFGLPALEDDLGGVNSGLKNVGKSAKKAKQEMLSLAGFEDINNITKPSEAVDSPVGGGIGSAGLGSGTYYDDLVGKLGDYDNLMGNVSKKASEIRDKILDWLGFTYDVNKVTGELSNLKWGGFSQMATSAKLATTAIGGLLAFKIGTKVKAFFTMFASGSKTAIKAFDLMFGTNAKGAIKSVLSMFSTNIAEKGLIKGIGLGAKEMWAMHSSSILLGGGLVALGGGMALASSGAKDFAREGELTATSTAKMAGGIASATAGGAMLGSIIPGVGTAIGAFAGFVVGGTTALLSYNKEVARLRYETELFDGMGVPIEDYTRSVVNSMKAVVQSNEETTKWINTHNKAKESLNENVESLSLLYSKMMSNVYTATAEDVEELNGVLNNMAKEVEASGEAFVNATMLMTNKLVEEGRISQETADKVVANAIRKKEAEGEFMESYTLSVKDLRKQLEQGTISQEDYNKSIRDLNKQMADMFDVSTSARESLGRLTQEASKKIDLKNYRALEGSIKSIGGEYDTSTEKLREHFNTQLDFIDLAIKSSNDQLYNLEKNGQRESEEYKAIKEELRALGEAREGLTTQFEEESRTLDLIVTESFGSIIAQLHATGEKLTPEARRISDDIISILSSMGYSVDFENGIVSSIRNSEGGVVASFGAMGTLSGSQLRTNTVASARGVTNDIANLPATLRVHANTSSALSAAIQARYQISQMKADILVGLKSDGRALNLGGSHTLGGGLGSLGSIVLRANGGLPPVGEFFMARENGPEMVGRMGTRNAVANNSQIVDGVTHGVAKGVAQVLGQGGNSSNGPQEINLYLPNGDRFVSWIIDEIDNFASSTGKGFKVA